jgi:hypothetical protein
MEVPHPQKESPFIKGFSEVVFELWYVTALRAVLQISDWTNSQRFPRYVFIPEVCGARINYFDDSTASRLLRALHTE